jgi:hypothetical protein
VASDIVIVCGVLKVPELGENVGVAAGVAIVSTAMLLVMPSKLAVIFVLPDATPVARPDVLIVAAAGFEDVQATVGVRFSVLPSA